MTDCVLFAPAKLNLFLHILGRREDGYHLIQSAMQLIDFGDTLRFSLRADERIHLVSNYTAVPVVDNLVYRAAVLLQQQLRVPRGVDIVLEKKIPVGAGLGGGSSDAATTLLGLNQLWGLDFSLMRLQAMGLSLGADVPVFVQGRSAWVEGIGEQLTPMTLPPAWYLLAIPACHIATAGLYQDPRLTRDCVPLTMDSYQPGDGQNVFTAVVQQDYPAVAEALSWLGQYAQARMTGTGSVVFARFDTEAEAGRIAASVPEGIRCVVAKGLNYSPNHWGVAKR